MYEAPVMRELQDLFDQAIAFHQRGDLGEAERLYLQILQVEPLSFAARHMLGVIRYQQGQYPQAIALITEALKRNPRVAAAWINLGNVQSVAGQSEDAVSSFGKALALSPGDLQTRHRRAEMLRAMKRFDEALEDYDAVLAARPDLAECWTNRGALLSEMGRPREALESLDRALELEPKLVAALSNRGFVLRELARFDEGLKALNDALALQPDYVPALAHRAKVLSEMRRLEESFRDFRRVAELNAGPGRAKPAHQIAHNRERQEWLAARGEASFRYLGGDRLPGPAVNPHNEHQVTRAWRASDPRIVVIDDLLSAEALEALRRYCRGSDVWHTAYEQGYLGAFPESGFAAPLLAQVADELGATFPDIFAGHPLRYHWAFQYDSTLEGIGIHADEAAVNVNFWITPDAANLDPQGGGLVIWDKEAPLDWDFAKFNADESAAYDFLASSGAGSIRIPYRANRAVIFDSNLFHKTDRISFAQGYENRRINITLLYGRRRRN